MANRRISPKAILILFALLLLICLPLTIGGILYMQGSKDPGAMVSAVQRRFAGASTRVVLVTPTPIGTPPKPVTPSPTPVPLDIGKEAGKKVADAEKLGGDASKKLEINPLTRGFVTFLGQKLPKEYPVIGEKSFGDAVFGIVFVVVFLVLVAGIIAKVTESPREKIMNSETVQSFLEDFWTWFVRLAGLAIYAAVITANIQSNAIKAFLLPFGSAFVIMSAGTFFEKFRKDVLKTIGEGSGLSGLPKLIVEFLFNSAEFVVGIVFAFIILFGGVFTVTASGRNPGQYSSEISKILTNIPWLSEFASKQLSSFANFLGAAIALAALAAPGGDLSIIGSLVGTILLFHDVKISGMLKRSEE